MICTMFAVAVIGLGVTVALAQQDPIAARKALMKANGEAAKTGAAMMKGEAPFDLDKARKVFATFENAASEGAVAVPGHFEDRRRHRRRSENLGEHGRLQGRLAKLGADAKDAGAKVTDLDSFKAAFGNIGKNDCGGCHEKYRVKKS